MTWRTTGDVAEFLDAAGAYLRRERARNTVLLTVTEQLRVNQARGPVVTSPIYQRIGYRGVEDRVVLTFSAPLFTGR
jgi:hypothetical protein